MPKLGHFVKKIRNTWKILKCDAEEARRRSVRRNYRVRNEEVLKRVKEERNIVQTINLDWWLLRRNCLLKHIIEGKIGGRIDVTGRWRRSKQLLYGLQEEREYWKLKGEALDRTRWRTRFGRGNGIFVRQTREWMNEWVWSNLTWNKFEFGMCLTHYIVFLYICTEYGSSIPQEVCVRRDIHNRGDQSNVFFVYLSSCITEILKFKNHIQMTYRNS